MAAPTHIRVFGTESDSIVDGPGLRCAIFTQGCKHACPGCHNPESHDPCGGTERSIAELVERIAENPMVQGVTLSGGDPFDQLGPSAELARQVKARGYNLWTYTGYRYEDLLQWDDPAAAQLLECTDVLVDGPFVQELASLDLKWRGSSNQRLIDVKKTRAQGEIVLWEQPSFVPPKPANW
ncbi:MAG: anaerobic ribonucleoside-triphosphate reductase activating protein [Coriobacteriia bacterium]|nr:anaerobic ribonucleoside-triphosphate reductase activating protein [Coriobacteriia bacterium]